MYERFFFLKEHPFHITPDPKFLYLSEKHQEALNLFYFGILEKKGFILLTGEVGTGKTTLCRAILDRLDKKVETALILNPLLSDFDLLWAINEDFGIRVNGTSMKEHLDALNLFLLKKAEEKGNAVVIIDEAQNLNPKTLEMIRLLSNLETEKTKLLQIALVGQPELRDKLKLPELRQLNQRVIVRYHLKPLNLEETKFYIFNRLAVAGGRGNVRFTIPALQRIYGASYGIPRLINVICDRTLMVAF
ncbi:MAG: AAA family ATPase, partial [Deltaproteobacteria bacterium]|nr:AAA family ATPase [Deltaproteobacteria bacterium]